jgi:hypothetical protein
VQRVNRTPVAPAGGVHEAWVQRYNGPANHADSASAIAIDKSGNVYVTGGSAISSIVPDYTTIKYHSAGQQQWVAYYNGPANNADFADAIAVDGSGNVYVTGESAGPGTYIDYATIKYNSSGQEQWVTRYDGPAHDLDRASAIAVDASGNVYVTGWSSGSGTGVDCATVKYDSAGQEQWVARYDGPVHGADQAIAIALDGSGNIYVTGYSVGSGTDRDWVTIKYDSAGQQLWVARYNGPANGADAAEAIALDGSGNVYVTGGSTGTTFSRFRLCHDHV